MKLEYAKIRYIFEEKGRSKDPDDAIDKVFNIMLNLFEESYDKDDNIKDWLETTLDIELEDELEALKKLIMHPVVIKYYVKELRSKYVR